LYSTQEECRQALAVAVAQAVAQYGKTLLADPIAMDVLLRQPTWLVGMQRSHPPFDPNGHQSETSDSPRAELTNKPPRGEMRAEISDSEPSASPRPAAFPQVTASGPTNLIEQPLYAETVQASVGEMQQLHALLELGDNARAQIREAWRQAAIPRRVRWAACGFGGAVAIVGLLLAALRFDLASRGEHRNRLRRVMGLGILLVVGSACGLCLL
jgi:hypothetical protein